MQRLPCCRRRSDLCSAPKFSKLLLLFEGYGYRYTPATDNNVCKRNVFISTVLPPITVTEYSYQLNYRPARFRRVSPMDHKDFSENFLLPLFCSTLEPPAPHISINNPVLLPPDNLGTLKTPSRFFSAE